MNINELNHKEISNVFGGGFIANIGNVCGSIIGVAVATEYYEIAFKFLLHRTLPSLLANPSPNHRIFLKGLKIATQTGVILISELTSCYIGYCLGAWLESIGTSKK